MIPKSIIPIIDHQSSKSLIKLIIRAKPGAKRSQIVQIDDEAIGVQIAAPPREGAANEELIDYMSHVFGIKSRHISLDVGTKSRNKILFIDFDTNSAKKTKNVGGGGMQQQQKQQEQIMTAEKVYEILKQNMEH